MAASRPRHPVRGGPSPAEVAGVAEGALARELAGAEGLPVLGPVLAAAAGELQLPLLALLGAVLQHAHGAHVGAAHDLVEALLALARLELPRGGGAAEREQGDDRGRGELHRWLRGSLADGAGAGG